MEDRTIEASGRELLTRVYQPGAAAGVTAKARHLLKSEDAALPVLVYIHGGGWVIQDINAVDTPARALANRAGCVAARVEYRRAP